MEKYLRKINQMMDEDEMFALWTIVLGAIMGVFGILALVYITIATQGLVLVAACAYWIYIVYSEVNK